MYKVRVIKNANCGLKVGVHTVGELTPAMVRAKKSGLLKLLSKTVEAPQVKEEVKVKVEEVVEEPEVSEDVEEPEGEEMPDYEGMSYNELRSIADADALGMKPDKRKKADYVKALTKAWKAEHGS